MSYSTISQSQVKSTDTTAYSIGSFRVGFDANRPVNARLSQAKTVRQKICLTIFDKFDVKPAGFDQVVHLIYEKNALKSVDEYTRLIKQEFPKSLMSIHLFDSEDYKSIFITIYPQVRYRQAESKYLALLDKTTKSPDYSGLLDIDYKILTD